MNRSLAVLTLPAVLSLTLAGCSTGGELPKVEGAFGRTPAVNLSEDPPSSSTSATVHEGDGAKVGENDLVVAGLTSFNWKEGGSDSDPDFSSPDLGADVLLSTAQFAQVMPDEKSALVGRHEGTRQAVFVAPGDKESKGKESLDAGALHVIDIRDHYSARQTVTGKTRTPDDPSLPSVRMSRERGAKIDAPRTDPPSELKEATLVKGNGRRVGRHDRVVVQFTGVLWDTSATFDSTWDWGGRPTAFSLGSKQVVPAWDKTLPGRTVGSRILMVVPPKWGFGDDGNASADISADDTLVYVVDILGTH